MRGSPAAESWISIFAFGVIAYLAFEVYRGYASKGIVSTTPQVPGTLNVAPGATLGSLSGILGVLNLSSTTPQNTITTNLANGSVLPDTPDSLVGQAWAESQPILDSSSWAYQTPSMGG